MKINEVKASVKTRIEAFLKKHPEDAYNAEDLAKNLDVSSCNIRHYKGYAVLVGNVNWWTYTESGRELLKRRNNGKD